MNLKSGSCFGLGGSGAAQNTVFLGGSGGMLSWKVCSETNSGQSGANVSLKMRVLSSLSCGMIKYLR